MQTAEMGAVSVLRTMRREVLPLVSEELGRWQGVAEDIADPHVRALALDSLRAKRFHCEGGSVFALWTPPGEARSQLVRAIVAVQTLSDFLDSLTDRAPDGLPWRPSDVLAAHRPFVAAVAALSLPPSPEPQDAASVYASRLAACAAAALGALPGIVRARPRLLALAMRYATMQSLKHGPVGDRVPSLRAWHGRVAQTKGEVAALHWAEFGAAAGSTLAMFRLHAWAAAPRGSAAAVASRYEPHLGALHILLDAVIDGPEDRESADLNWVDEMAADGDARRRLAALAAEGRRRLAGDAPGTLLVPGLVAIYLSDPKGRHVPRAWRWSLGRAAGIMSLPLAAWLRRRTRRGDLGARPAQLRRAWGRRAPDPTT